MKKYIWLLLFILLSTAVMADMGPKPTVLIKVKIDGNEMNYSTMTGRMLHDETGRFVEAKHNSVVMLECSNPAGAREYEDGMFFYKDKSDIYNKITERDIREDGCYWHIALFAWGGDASKDGVRFWYHPPNNFKVAVDYNDQLYVTNNIDRIQFNSEYTVYIKNGKATVKDTTPIISFSKIISFLVALAATLVIELFITLIFIFIFKWPYSLLKTIIKINIMSLPFVWFIFPIFFEFNLAILIGELFALFFEFYMIKKQYEFSGWKVFLLALVMNTTSYMIGIIFFELFGLIALVH